MHSSRPRRGLGLFAAAVVVFVAAGCTSASTSQPTTDTTSGTSAAAPDTATADEPSSPDSSDPTEVTVSESPTTIVTTVHAQGAQPPPATPEPEPTAGECPYISSAEIADANGQRVSKTLVIATEPYPVCEFYRADGTVQAVTRVVVADSAGAAKASVDQHVPVADSFPVSKPPGWEGGAKGQQDGVGDYSDARSIYAVSRGDIAVIALSNQKESVKGRQIVTLVIDNLGLS